MVNHNQPVNYIPKGRLARARAAAPIVDILHQQGFQVRLGSQRKQYIRCHLHGSGKDSRPSAAVYPDSNSWFCWGCQQYRDSIKTIQDSAGLSQEDAIKWVERVYNLPVWVEPIEKPLEVLALSFDDQNNTLGFLVKRLRWMIQSIHREQDVPMDEVAKLWFAFDEWVARIPTLEESAARESAAKLQGKVLEWTKRSWSNRA